ncbi:MAG: FG-GAP repeat protein [Planctomycetes bacterium]|nr:FG-GAP repeat protein [Planctomycetota bacterium]
MKALAVVAFLALTMGGAVLLLWLVRPRPPEPLPTCLFTDGRVENRSRVFSASSAGDIDGDGVTDVLTLESTEARDEARVYSGKTRLLLRTFQREVADFGGGSALACGDLDGDGQSEFLVPRPVPIVHGAWPGEVLVLSGADGSVRETLRGATLGDGFGSSLAALGDVDGDSVADFAVASPSSHPDDANPNAEHGRGAVTAFSGRELRLLTRIEGRHEDARFGSALAVLGDLDGDGASEWLASATEEDGVGCVEFHSGRTGELVRTVRGDVVDPGNSDAASGFGSALAALGDIDGDGAPDFAAASIEQWVALLSGRDGSCLRLVPAHPQDDRGWYTSFGTALAPAGDVDRDGVTDVVVAAANWSYRMQPHGLVGGRVFVYSGRTGVLLVDLRDRDGLSNLGSSIVPLGDTDGDGVFELLATTQHELRVYSLR